MAETQPRPYSIHRSTLLGSPMIRRHSRTASADTWTSPRHRERHRGDRARIRSRWLVDGKQRGTRGGEWEGEDYLVDS